MLSARNRYAPATKTRKKAQRELALYVRERTDQGRDLADTLVDVMHGMGPMPVEAIDVETGERVWRQSDCETATTADRVKAAQTLKLWGWGREPLVLDVGGDVSLSVQFDLGRLSANEVRAYLELTKKMRALPVSSESSGTADVVDVAVVPVTEEAGDARMDGDGVAGGPLGGVRGDDALAGEDGPDLQPGVAAGEGSANAADVDGRVASEPPSNGG